jgi:hypothetical protein
MANQRLARQMECHAIPWRAPIAREAGQRARRINEGDIADSELHGAIALGQR